MKKWFVYILQCNDGRLYIGMTNDIERRLKEHASGKGGHFTKSFGVSRFLYKEEYDSRIDAMKRESQLKGWTKRKKIALIQGDTQLLKEL
jgi:putative endonuclease